MARDQGQVDAGNREGTAGGGDTAPSAVIPSGRRRRVLVALAILGVLGLAAGIGAYVRHHQHAEPQPPAASLEGLEPAVAAAVEEARRAVQKLPQSAGAWGRLGMVLFAARFRAEAETCFTRAEQLDARDPRWPFFQGKLLSLKDSETAIPKFRRAAELCGDQPDTPRLRLAELLLEQGSPGEAGTHFNYLLRRHPSHPVAHLGLARLAYERDDWPGCLRHLKECTASPFSQKAARTLMATVYARLGDRPAANRQRDLSTHLPEDRPWPDPFSRELAQFRLDKRSRLMAGGQLLAQHRLPEAIVTLSDLVRDEPDLYAAWRDLGYAYFQAEDYANAEWALHVALRLEPDSAEGHYYLGCTALNQGKHEQAVRCFRKATELKPDYAMAHYNLGRSLGQQGKRAAAIEAFRTALRSRPYLALAQRDLGELLMQNGDKAEALVHLRYAVELDPSDEKAKALLRQLNGQAAR